MPSSTLSMAQGLPPFPGNPLVSMALFYDFTDTSTITFNGPGIAQINDKSGNNRHATQATSSQHPTLIANAIGTKSVARFSASNTSKLSFDGSFVVGTNYLFVIAATVNSDSAAAGTVIGGSTSGGNENLTLARNSATSWFYSQHSNDHNWNTLVNSGNLEIVSVLSDGIGKAGYQNGNSIGSTTNTTQLIGWNGASLGHRSDADWRFTGDIVYVMFAIGGDATNTNRQILEGWSAWQLNLVGNLPSGHPYKSAPP